MTSPLPIPVPKTIVLVGLMGAGKSCIGRLLAQRLGLDFIDADEEIEKAAQCSIDEIFERHGEAEFRDGERRVIARILDGPVHVLAAGGGAIMDKKTRAKIQSQAISVWLRADLDLLVQRVSRRHNRPLLKNGEPRDILENLMKTRHPIYAKADVVVDSDSRPPKVIVDRVIKALKEVLGTANEAKGQDQLMS